MSFIEEFDEIFKLWPFPRMGEVKRYKIVPMTENDIIEEEIKEIKNRIAQRKKTRDDFDKQTAELEEKLQKQKKRLNP
jgi:F0F1-type ATP synthase membrane subunit b/b'